MDQVGNNASHAATPPFNQAHQGLRQDRAAVVRRPRGADRAHASRAGRRAALARRATLSLRPQLLHAAARPRGDAARDLFGLAAARRQRRACRRPAVRPARRAARAGAVGALRRLRQTPTVAALFVGVKAAVLAIVLQALVRVASRAIKGRLDWAVAIAAFVAIFFFDLPFPLGHRRRGRGRLFPALQRHDRTAALQAAAPVPVAQTLRTLAVWLAVWLVPLFAVAASSVPDHVLAQLAFFFSKLAVVTFGGAYAVLAYMAQEAVDQFGGSPPARCSTASGSPRRPTVR